MTDNPMLCRIARVAVQIKRDVLTNEGEMSDETGWRDVERVIQKALDGIASSTSPRSDFYPGTITISFEEWEAEPEVV
jgi:hypothetical protein